ncbi:5a831eb6-8aef-40c0-9068-caafcbf24433-CDS [Sclerotinia trifoliorum]|uniref:5a831eb6-8aef-40c0-9068-caafcbf24433-CDS n=1 Tax=Sclerotinia trifoliorum TaxID=28548 RepID=A0A8H2VN14_9HELO|nr:5a831eb6-8aef-40c0-9068-caafcbf24433-CDS [Sclerotinia trifoliorum]
MRNHYSHMSPSSKAQQEWPLKSTFRRLKRSLLRRPSTHSQKAPQKASRRLPEPPLLVDNPELDLVNILSSTINTTPANLNAGPVYQHQRQNTLEDPRRFNVLDVEAQNRVNQKRERTMFGGLKRKISDKHPRPTSNSPPATRETPSSFGIIQERTSMDLVIHRFPAEYYNFPRPPTPKTPSRSQEVPPVRAAKSLRSRISRTFSRNGKGKGKGGEHDFDMEAYPLEIKMVKPNPAAPHPALDESTASASSRSDSPNLSQRRFSQRDLLRPNTSASSSTSKSISAASTRGTPLLTVNHPSAIQRAFSSSSLRSQLQIVVDVPVIEAQEVKSPPPTYSASMDFAMKGSEKTTVNLSDHPALAGVDAGASSSSVSQNQSIPTSEESAPVATVSAQRTRALSNAPRPSMTQTVRSSFDNYGSTTITTQTTHDTVAPLLIRKTARGSSPKRFASLKRSLSDLTSRPPPSRSQSQDTGLANLNSNTSPKAKRTSTSSTSSKSYYTLGSAEAAMPGVSRSLTVLNAKRNSTISSPRSSFVSTKSHFSANANIYPRSSTSTIRSVPQEVEFLPTKAAPIPTPTPTPAPAFGSLRNFSKPSTARSQTQRLIPAEKINPPVPRRAKTDFLKSFEVPNLMMDCGGYDVHEFSYADYTYVESESELGYAAYSTGQMIKEVAAGGAGNGEGENGNGDGEFEKFILDAREGGRGEKGRILGRNGIVEMNLDVDMKIDVDRDVHTAEKKNRGVWRSLRRKDRNAGVRG